MRSAPHNRFSTAIVVIKAIVSSGIRGLVAGAADLAFQKGRNPWRCQRRRVSG
jgi:hypothetical protein